MLRVLASGGCELWLGKLPLKWRIVEPGKVGKPVQ